MRRAALLGVRMHGGGTNLDFKNLTRVGSHHGVQRLITVGLGLGDVVVELARQRGPHGVHHAQGGIAGTDVTDDDAQGSQVHHLLELQMLALHLAPDAVDVFGSANHLGGDVLPLQFLLQQGDGRADALFALDAPLVQFAGDVFVNLGLHQAERQVFHLPLDLPDAQTIRQRGIDLHAFSQKCRRRGLLGAGEISQGLQP